MHNVSVHYHNTNNNVYCFGHGMYLSHRYYPGLCDEMWRHASRAMNLSLHNNVELQSQSRFFNKDLKTFWNVTRKKRKTCFDLYWFLLILIKIKKNNNS